MKIIQFTSRPNTQFHFGEASYSGENNLNKTSVIFHSDSLYAAFIDSASKFSEKSVNTILDWIKGGKLNLSTLFFAIKEDDKIIHFLPKPIILNLVEHKERKKLKKIDYISLSVFNDGLMPNDWFSEKCKIIQDKFVVLTDELSSDIDKIYSIKSRPKVRVHTDEDEGNFYYQSNVELIRCKDFQVNYYCFLDHSLNESELKLFDLILDNLKYSGIGGERSTGCGAIDNINISNLDITEKNDTYKLNLSLLSPKDEEIKNCLFYKTILRGGKSFSSEEKAKFTEMLQEGAIIDSNIKGKILDLGNPENPYLKVGKPLVINLPNKYSQLVKNKMEEQNAFA